MESTEDPQREGQSIATHDACPEDREEIGRAKKCEGCPGQALCQSMGGTDPGILILNTYAQAHS
jgi:hypothetical protein